jgi:hypothetical protein
MTSDDVCERYADRHVGLTVRQLEDDDSEQDPTVLIEGSSDALRMLAELLLSVADDSNNDGFGISPNGAGKAHFSVDATLGIYIHRTDGERPTAGPAPVSRTAG